MTYVAFGVLTSLPLKISQFRTRLKKKQFTKSSKKESFDGIATTLLLNIIGLVKLKLLWYVSKWKWVLLEAQYQHHGKCSRGYEKNFFERDDRTGRCHSKTLTAMKRWIPFVFWFQPEFLLVNSAARRLLMANGHLPFARKIRSELNACNGFSRCAASYTKSTNQSQSREKWCIQENK